MFNAGRFASVLTGTALASFLGSVTFCQDAAQPAAVNGVVTPKPIASDLYQFPPQTPVELLKAARITQELERFSDSRAFLRMILDMQLGENELQAFRSEVGAGPFLDLRLDIQLRPESEQLLAAVNEASKSKTYTAQEFQDFVKNLSTPGFVGTTAVTELVAGGDLALPALLAADPKTPSGSVAHQILAKYARPWRAGLLKQLESADSPTRVRIVNLLGSTSDPELAIRLLRWQFGPSLDAEVMAASRQAISELSEGSVSVASASEAVELLTNQAKALLKLSGKRFSLLDQPQSLTELTNQSPRRDKMGECRVLLSDALAIEPDNNSVLQTLLVAECAELETTLSSEASVVAGKPADELLRGLAQALELHPVAAVEFLRGLRSMSVNDVNQEEAGRIFNIALLSPDARVRFLTAEIVRKTMPIDVSAAAVSRSLQSARNGSLKPEVVIVSGNAGWRGDLELVFEDAGYDPKIASTGPEGFELAAGQMTCELFILDAASPRWPIATTLANLRADVRTQNTPIIVIGQLRFQQRVLALSQIHAGVWFIPEPAGSVSLISKLAQKNLPGNVLTMEDRTAMKKLAE